MALKLKFVKGLGLVTYESMEKKKEHKDESVVFTETGTGEDEKDVARVIYVNDVMNALFLNFEVYLNNQQIYNSNGLYAQSLTFQTTLWQASLNTREFCIVKAMTMNRILRIILTPYLIPFYLFTRRMKLLSRPDGFMLYGKLGIDFLSTSELLYPNMKSRLRLIRARPNFYMIRDNPNVSLGTVDCSLYTRCIAFKDDYHKKRMDMLAYAPVEYNYLETLGKTFIIPARQNQFFQQNIFNNAPIRRVAIAMNTNSAFTASFTENPF